MRVTKIDKPVAVFRKALGYDPVIPIGPVEPPEFEGAFVLIPRDNDGIEFVPAPTVTDGDLDTYAETDAHDEAMRITMDVAIRLTSIVVLGAWETAGEKTYTLEGANFPDFVDAVELASATFDALDDWEPVEFTYEYSSSAAYQYYRLIGPDEVRRWHNIRLIQASVDGCECLELCRDTEPPSLVVSASSPESASSNPITLGVEPEPGDLWIIWATTDVGDTIDGFDLIAGPIAVVGGTVWAMWQRICESGDSGSVTTAPSAHQWRSSLFRGAGAADEVVELDDQTAVPGTLEVPITVPSGDHLTVGFFCHEDITTAGVDAESGWTLLHERHFSGDKITAAVYDIDGGGALTPGITVTEPGPWLGFAASFPIGEGEAGVFGGPDARAGDGDKAAPCNHHHAYTAEQIAFTPAGTIAATNVQDAIEEAVAEAGGGTPATTVESETTFGITPAVGTDTEYARQDHTHGSPANPLSGAALVALGLVGPLLIADDHSTPLVFEDILQTEEGDDFLYADIGA